MTATVNDYSLAKNAEPSLVSGLGQHHSDRNKAKPQAYLTISLSEIEAMLPNPQQVRKAEARWFIPSTLMDRRHAKQHDEGEYWALWAETDEPTATLNDMVTAISAKLPGVQILAYTTRSATVKKQKARFILPLDETIDGKTFIIMQRIFNSILAEANIVPDRANERAGQLCYLPNRGDFYETQNLLGDPLSQSMWHDRITQAVEEQKQEQKAQTERMAAAKVKQHQRQQTDQLSPIDAFNEAYELPLLFVQYGYPKKGSKWLSPNSSSKSPGVTIKDNRWMSSHESDRDVGVGRANDSGASGDAFDLFCFYEHGNDRTAALKALGSTFTTPDGTTLTKSNQRNYMQQPAAAGPLMANSSGANWPNLADPFTEYPVPAFPMEILPDAFKSYCEEKSAQSGFDPGGYAFCLLITAANTIDHRAKLNLGPFKVPAFLWGGIVGDSGQGKSPVIKTSTFAADDINTATVKESIRLLRKWENAVKRAAIDKTDKTGSPPKPEWKQRHATDLTTEALAQLLGHNPEGVNLYFDEITEFIGRMDAYSGKDGGKDRGVYLRSYDGGQVSINRVSRTPLVVEDFSVGILAGIQPEKLAQLFKKSGGGSDGLYQRFLMYCLRPAGEVDYMAHNDPLAASSVSSIFKTLDGYGGFQVELSNDAKRMMMDYHNSIRKLAQRTSAQRFGEHLDKFPGMLGRISFSLHLIDAAANETDPRRLLKPETMDKGMKLMGVLYRHSESVYRVLDMQTDDIRKLVVSTAEAALAKKWSTFKRGDLTRDATYWQQADNHQAEAAIDNLIELGWIVDITPATVPGKRGRRSDGVFSVNPLVHKQFQNHAARIKQARTERYAALKNVTISN